MKALSISLSLLFILTGATAYADTKNFEVNVGGTRIQIKAPSGFREVSALSPETRQLVETMTPPTVGVLAVLVPEDDYGRIAKGQALLSHRYIVLLFPREAEFQSLGLIDFQQFISQVRGQELTIFREFEARSGRVFGDLADRMAAGYDVVFDAEVGEIVPIGMFLDQPDAFGTAILVKAQVSTEDGTFESLRVAATAMLLTKGKVLSACVYSTFDSPEDIEWATSVTVDLANSILLSNTAPAQSIFPVLQSNTQDEKMQNWVDHITRAIGLLIVMWLVAKLTGKSRGKDGD